MVAKTGADALVLIHLMFMLFVVLGGLLVLKWRSAAWLHAPCAAWGALVEFGGWVCPLTRLENHLRTLAGAAGYPGGFVDHYVAPVVYPAGLTRGVQLALGAAVVGLNGAVYGLAFARARRARLTSSGTHAGHRMDRADAPQRGVEGENMQGTKRADIRPGLRVSVVLKRDQRTGKRTEGVVKAILTKSATHPHGIKVRLESGEVGRVKEILG